jgi:hypothetical protein
MNAPTRKLPRKVTSKPAIKTIELELPAHWAPYLINGDANDMSKEEIAELDACLTRQDVGFCVEVEAAESFFSISHEARIEGVAPCQCFIYTFEV